MSVSRPTTIFLCASCLVGVCLVPTSDHPWHAVSALLAIGITCACSAFGARLHVLDVLTRLQICAWTILAVLADAVRVVAEGGDLALSRWAVAFVGTLVGATLGRRVAHRRQGREWRSLRATEDRGTDAA